MNDRLAFLRAIRENPDDDTARLVFADWLDERDDPLGQLVRVQLELEPIRYRIDDPRARELHKREDELFRAHGDDWITTNELLTNPADFGPVYRRGLPDYACLSLDTFLQNGEALFTAYPTLREVALYGVTGRCDELTLCGALANLDTLEIADWPTEQDAAALAVSPYLELVPRFKLWLGGEPWMLREFVRQATEASPREIELVQVYGGAACGDPGTARELNDEADRIAGEANERLGFDAVRVTRPFERLFPLDGEVGHDMCAGRLPDGRPAVAAGGFAEWVLVAFTADGRVRDVAVRESPVRESPDPSRYVEDCSRLGLAFEEWVYAELRLEPGVIRVREFTVEGLSVAVWPEYMREHVQNPYPELPPGSFETAEGWRERGAGIRSWLERRNFVVNWLGEHWADWRGKIHSS